jgi:DNA modification methylase
MESCPLVFADAPEYPILRWVKPESLTPNPRNWRVHTKEQTALVTDLLLDKSLGWADVLLYNIETNEFINGHLRREIALQHGIDRVPVLIGKWSREKQNAIHAALDLSTGMAKTDPGKLFALIKESAPPTDRAAEIVRSVARSLGVVDIPPEGSEGNTDDPGESGDGPSETGPTDAERIEMLRRKWDCQPGQVWWARSPDGTIAHRLLIGDCTRKADVDLLFGDVYADMLFTSPPYGNQRDYDAGPVNWDSLMHGVAWNLPVTDNAQLFFNLGIHYKDGEWVEYWQPFLKYMNEQGWRRFGWYVWDQGGGLAGDWHGRLAPSFEFVFHFNKNTIHPNKVVACRTAGEDKSNRKTRFGPRNPDGGKSGGHKIGDPYITPSHKIHDSVVRVPRGGSQGIAHLHPAIYSIDLPAEFIKSYSSEGAIVYDPFGGSLTTTLACQQTGRTSYSMEISPGYFAIGLERLDAAGLNPRRCE